MPKGTLSGARISGSGRIQKIYYPALSGSGRIVKFDIRPIPSQIYKHATDLRKQELLLAFNIDYIHDLMEINRHMLVFINSFTKNFMFLGLTSVDFYFYHHLYSPAILQASIWVVEINPR